MANVQLFKLNFKYMTTFVCCRTSLNAGSHVPSWNVHFSNSSYVVAPENNEGLAKVPFFLTDNQIKSTRIPVLLVPLWGTKVEATKVAEE
jgi:hypothetical protein